MCFYLHYIFIFLSSIVKLVLFINIRSNTKALNVIECCCWTICRWPFCQYFSVILNEAGLGCAYNFLGVSIPFKNLSGIIVWLTISFEECEPGFIGTNCSRTCPPGYFGRRCDAQSNCSRDMYCEPARGCLCITTSGNCTDQGTIL